jgi:HAD superfamily hydrolase (TIGR01662 family)
MFENIEWLFFDVGSTLVDEHMAYEHRLRDIAALANVSYERIYKDAIALYKDNKKGDLEVAKQLDVKLPEWYIEDEILYKDSPKCMELLSAKYNIGIVANQSLGTKERLEQHGILQYINLVVASAEEGFSKPDSRIFQIALDRSGCKPQKAVMIGDRIDNDIVPAKLLGMRTIWVKQGFGQYWNISSQEEKADCVVNDIKEICAYL